MTTKLFGTKVERTEDERFLRGLGRYVDDVGAGALHAAVLRSPHAHARILAIDVDAVLDVEGVHAVWTYDDLTGAMAEPLPLLIPHPALTHGRTQYALAKDEVNYVGEAIAFVVADRPLHRRGRAGRDPGRLRVPARPVVGIDNARAATHLVHDDVPGNVGARMEQENGDARAAIAAAPHTLTLDLTIERSACMPMEGRGTVARWDPDSVAAPGVDLDADLDRRPRRGGRQARPRPRPGRRDHPRRRRRLRRQDQPPVARGAAGPAGRAGPRPAGEVHRGPPRALHLHAPTSAGRCSTSRSASTTRAGCSGST